MSDPLPILHKVDHLVNGHVSLLRVATGCLKQRHHLIGAEQSILTTNVSQYTVEVVQMEGLVIRLFNLSDNVLAEARRKFVREIVFAVLFKHRSKLFGRCAIR